MHHTQPAQTLKSIAYQLSAWQFGAVLLLALLSLLLSTPVFAYSLVLGGLTIILPNFFFAQYLFKKWGATSITQIVKALYGGELMKLAACGVITIILIKTIPLNFLSFVLGLLAAQCCFWGMPFYLQRRGLL